MCLHFFHGSGGGYDFNQFGREFQEKFEALRFLSEIFVKKTLTPKV